MPAHHFRCGAVYMQRILTVVIAVAVLGGLSASALAQGDAVQRLERSLRQAEVDYLLRANPALSIGERAMLEYGGLVNFAILAIDEVDQETHILRQTDVQLFAHLSIDGAHEFFGRLRFTYDDWNTGDDFDGRGDRLDQPLGDRWWYKFDLRRAIEASEGTSPDYNLTVKVGRQFVEFGSGIVLSDELYGVRVLGEIGPFEIEGLVGMTPSNSFIDFDSSRPDFDRNAERLFYGGKLAFTGIDGHKPYVFALAQEDDNNDSLRTIGVAGIATPTRFGYDSHYIGVGSTGTIVDRLLYTAEFVYQGGESLSTPIVLAPGPTLATQTREDIEAWAAKFQLTYLVRGVNRTRLEFETLVASGDDDRLADTSNTIFGNKSGSSDKSFNAFGFSKTGLAFAAPISNLLMFRAGASTFPLPETKPFKNLQVGIDLFMFNKLDSDAPIDEGTSDDSYLGVEADVFVAWRITSDVALNVRYGIFVPGEAISVDHDTRHFFYTGVSYSF